MKVHRDWLFSGALVSVALVVLLGIWFVVREPHGPTQILPDGTTLELIVTTPPNCDSVVVGSLWERSVRPWLRERFPLWGRGLGPLEYASAWGAPTLEHGCARLGNDAGHVALWFRVRHADPSILAATMPTITATEDSHGCRIENWQSFASNYEKISIPETGTGRPGGAIGVVRLFTYPRREPRFDFLVQSSDRSTVLARFPVVNPALRLSWDTSGNAIPVSCRRDGWVFRLMELAKTNSGRNVGRIRARFRVERDGHRVAEWVPDRVKVRDNSGNSEELAVERDGEDCWFDGLCLREPAWRLGVGFVKRDPERDAPDYTWEIRDLPAPTGDWANCERTISSPGALLRILALKDAYVISSPSRPTMRPQLHLQLGTPAPVGVRVLSVTDSQGRSLTCSGHGSAEAVSDAREFVLPVPALRPAPRWNMVLGAYIRREAEFFVRP